MADLIVPNKKRLIAQIEGATVIANGSQPRIGIQIEGMTVQEVAMVCHEAMKVALGAQEQQIGIQISRLQAILDNIPDAVTFDRVRGETLAKQMVS